MNGKSLVCIALAALFATARPALADEDAFDYMLDPFHALQFARENEQRAAQFYQSVADDTADDEVKRLALEFAEEEQEHTEQLDAIIARTQRAH